MLTHPLIHSQVLHCHYQFPFSLGLLGGGLLLCVNLSLIKYLIRYCSCISANDQQVKHGGPARRGGSGAARVCSAGRGLRAMMGFAHPLVLFPKSPSDGCCWTGPISQLVELQLLLSRRCSSDRIWLSPDGAVVAQGTDAPRAALSWLLEGHSPLPRWL